MCRRLQPCRTSRSPDLSNRGPVWTRRLAGQRTSRFRIAPECVTCRASTVSPPPVRRNGIRRLPDVQGSQQASRGRAGGRRLHRSRQQMGQSVPDRAQRRPRRPSSRNTSAGSRINITCCARPTSCAGAILSASARRVRATAICCCARQRDARTAHRVVARDEAAARREGEISRNGFEPERSRESAGRLARSCSPEAH